jgi:DNA primase
VAGRLDDALMREIRERNNIVQVVGDYVSLRKAGGSYKGLCPFHSERSPSFTVQEKRGFFYCFGCQAGGDVISFVRELHGYGFMEAVRHLAERVGIDLPESAPQRGPVEGNPAERQRQAAEKRQSKRKDQDAFYRVGRAALRYYVDTLQSLEGKLCRTYLRERGLEREAVERFALGYAPDRWDGLATEMGRQQLDMNLSDSVGLVGRRRDGSGFYDKFRGRLMFPIRNLAGEVIAFGGRILPGTEASKPREDGAKVGKYINSPDSPVYNKGHTLFGLYEARKSMRKGGVALVVEGNVDVVALSQAGFSHVVAPMGTALTPEQCQLLRRFVSRAVLLYDGDSAGQAAAAKATPLALAEGLQIGVVTLAEGDDPDTLVQRDGAEALQAAIDDARSGWVFLVDNAIAACHVRTDAMAGIPRAVDQLAPVLLAVRDRRERTLYSKHLAEALGLDIATLNDFLRDARGPVPLQDRARESAERSSLEQSPPSPPPPDAELRLLVVALLHPSIRPLYRARDAGRLLQSSVVRMALDRLTEDEEEQDAITFASEVGDTTLRTLLFRQLADGKTEEGDPGEFEVLLNRLNAVDLRRRRDAMDHQERPGDGEDEAAWQRLLAEKKKLEQQVERLKGA